MMIWLNGKFNIVTVTRMCNRKMKFSLFKRGKEIMNEIDFLDLVKSFEFTMIFRKFFHFVLLAFLQACVCSVI